MQASASESTKFSINSAKNCTIQFPENGVLEVPAKYQKLQVEQWISTYREGWPGLLDHLRAIFRGNTRAMPVVKQRFVITFWVRNDSGEVLLANTQMETKYD